MVARRALARVEQAEAYATLALSAELTRAKLSDVDSRLATEICYGVLRHRLRIDRALSHYMHKDIAKVAPKVLLALRVAAYQMLFLDRIPDHAAVDDAVTEVRRIGGAKLAGFANGLLRKLAREGEPPLPEGSGPEALMAKYSLPPWLFEQLQKRLTDEDLERAAQGMQSVPPLSIRVNRRRNSVEDLRKRLLEGEAREVQTCEKYPWALTVGGLGSPEHSQSFAEGLWTVQDVAAQLIGAMAAPSEGQRVLDACAGVGGKTTHLAEMDPSLEIHAIDLSPKKIQLLNLSKKRLGLANIHSRIFDATRRDEEWKQAGLAPDYDLVLLDAPCSGLGVLRRHPERKWATRKNAPQTDLRELVLLQETLLEALSQRVAPGGVLLYSVCTFTDEEGPQQVQRFLERHPEFALSAPEETENSPQWSSLLQNGVLETWPHRGGHDAFFAARLTRR